MWTQLYKGAYIHGYADKPKCFVQYGRDPASYVRRGPFPSMDAAKRFIRDAIRNGDHVIHE